MTIPQTEPTGPTRFQFTVDTFMALDRLGAFPADRHVELINGEIITMPPIDPPHAESTHKSQLKLQRLVGQQFEARGQLPIDLSPVSLPQPDVVIATKQSYAARHPTPTEVHLVLEISDATLNQDLTTKRDLYAQAGVPEYWVLDIPNRQLHVFTKPRRGNYTEQHILMEKETVQCTTVPRLKVKVKDLLP